MMIVMTSRLSWKYDNFHFEFTHAEMSFIANTILSEFMIHFLLAEIEVGFENPSKIGKKVCK